MGTSNQKNTTNDDAAGVSDGAITYQLEKVDQGGAVMELFEDRIQWLAEQWGYEVTEETGEIMLPDGRLAGLEFEAYIRDREPGETFESEE